MTEVGEGLNPRQEAPRNTEGELPEVKIFDLLSSVGNGENKALDLIVMREDVIYSRYALWKEIMNHQAKGREWRMSNTTPFSHCELSLSPIGFVTKKALSPDGSVWGYQTTQYGLRTGVPFAGALLKWSYEHPTLSLYKMSASAHSHSIKDEKTLDKKRAQETRCKILWEIATNPSNRIRLIDIANVINEDKILISDHMVSLRKNGVISYEAIEYGKPQSYFKRKEIVPDQEPTPYRREKILSTRLYGLINQRFMQTLPTKYLSIEEIANALIQEYPEYEMIRRYLIGQMIAGCLTNFERQGYVEREKFSNDLRSEITLSEEQREAVVSFVTVLDNLKNGDKETLEEGRRFAQRVLNDPNLFSELMLKAKDASPSAGRTNKEDMEGWLVSIIYQHPNSTLKQVQQTLEEDYDKRLTYAGVRSCLSILVEQGKIVSDKTKAGNVYIVAEVESQTTSSQP